MQRMTVLAASLARSLNLRTEVAQVGVSMLGKIFRILRLPARLARLTSARSLPTSENAGAWSPLTGRRPLTSAGLPPRVTVVVILDLQVGVVVNVVGWMDAST